MAGTTPSHDQGYDPASTTATVQRANVGAGAGGCTRTASAPSTGGTMPDYPREWYDAEDRRQRDEAARLAEADGDTCDHRRTRIRLIEECECGMVIHEAVVQR